jgi:hypothetical protein
MLDRAGIWRMIRIVTTTPIARMPPKTATNGPSAPASGTADGATASVALTLDDLDDLEADVTKAKADADDDADGAAEPEAGETIAAILVAARFSPHSTQKRAPVTTGASHCGQNRTASSGLEFRRTVPLLLHYLLEYLPESSPSRAIKDSFAPEEMSHP